MEVPLARPRKLPNLSPGQASYVLERLRRAGRVTDAAIRRYISEMAREIQDLELRLTRLRAAANPDQRPRARDGGEIPTPFGDRGTRRSPATKRAELTGAAASMSATPAKPRKRKFTVTPKVLASRELQGRYLPLLNKFSGRRRKGFALVAKERGREAAIKEMESALRT